MLGRLFQNLFPFYGSLKREFYINECIFRKDDPKSNTQRISILENQRKEISIKFKQKREDRQMRTDINVFEKTETEKNSQ